MESCKYLKGINKYSIREAKGFFEIYKIVKQQEEERIHSHSVRNTERYKEWENARKWLHPEGAQNPT